MALWAALVALALGTWVIVSMTPEAANLVQAGLALTAILGLFALICAYESKRRP